MLDIGWSELLLIGVVALIVVGPKDLPKMFHQLGRITAKAKSMAREFSRAMEDAAKDTGLDEAAGSVRDLKSLASKKSLGLDALEKATDAFEKWEPGRSERTSLKPDPEAEPPKPEAAQPEATAAETAKPETSKTASKPAAKPAAKKAASKTAAKTGAKTGSSTAAKSSAKPATKSSSKPAAKTGAKPAAKKTAAKKPAAKKGDA
ncbi:twin arginine-targeting protein translocase TatB [Thioclava sp. JM3]|uniref:Sec-independent protein translocase protein TatB n=1 Tax=unclassified Thioclava TaxID=2621713 RepID=UPI000B54884A|nr:MULTISPECIES: Sec-independent protein translocase protein TatB [unclassified Thioclava]OWY10089.1 twin arginine-targeting protein translocase TatB [Thioclava sp. F42-5]OWY17378.1 twin arginine-targeting protein translocase TatB [Thioclava sp. JM3]